MLRYCNPSRVCYSVSMKTKRKVTVDQPIHVRLTDDQLARLDEMSVSTGLSRSQVIRHLIDQASIRPAIIRTEAPVMAKEIV